MVDNRQEILESSNHSHFSTKFIIHRIPRLDKQFELVWPRWYSNPSLTCKARRTNSNWYNSKRLFFTKTFRWHVSMINSQIFCALDEFYFKPLKVFVLSIYINMSKITQIQSNCGTNLWIYPMHPLLFLTSIEGLYLRKQNS